MNYLDTIAETLFDRQTYPANPSWDKKFFQTPMGQNGKTEAETNMYLAGQLPREQRFLVYALDIVFLPSAGLSKEQRRADINAVARAGLVEFRIQDRVYAKAAPLAAVPAAVYWSKDKNASEDSNFIETMRAQLSEQFAETDYGAFGGKPFDMVPLFIESMDSFEVRVTKLAPLPSGEDGTLWCRLHGRLMRPCY